MTKPEFHVSKEGYRIFAPTTQKEIPDEYTVSDRCGGGFKSWILWEMMEQGVPVPFQYSDSLGYSPLKCEPTPISDFTADISLLERKVHVRIKREILHRGSQHPSEIKEVTLTIPSAGDTFSTLIAKINENLVYFKKNVSSHYHELEKKIYTYDWNPQHGSWNSTASKANRSWDSIAIESETLHEIKEDVTMFMKFLKLEHFDNIGRRIYMFHGPPGSGKSSLALTIASQLGGDLYRIRSTLSDAQLAKAINNTNAIKTPVILIEDADELFAKQDGDVAGVPQFQEKHTDLQYAGVHKNAPDMDSVKTGLTYSGILNALDGSDAPSKALFILSSNRAHSYDQALLRRINRTWHIAGTSAATVAKFLQYFVKANDPSPTICERISKTLNKQGLQMSTLQECCVRALYAKNIDTGEETVYPTPEEVLDQILKYKPLSHTSLVAVTQKTNGYIG